MCPDIGAAALVYMNEPCIITEKEEMNVVEVTTTSDPCIFHPKNAKLCPPRTRLRIPWALGRTINATPLIALNHSGSCVKVERIPGGATFHMLLGVTTDKWEISLIHIISPVIPLKLGK